MFNPFDFAEHPGRAYLVATLLPLVPVIMLLFAATIRNMARSMCLDFRSSLPTHRAVCIGHRRRLARTPMRSSRNWDGIRRRSRNCAHAE